MPVYQFSSGGFIFVANTEPDAVNYGIYDRAPYKKDGKWVFSKPIAVGKLIPQGFDNWVLERGAQTQASDLKSFAIYKVIEGSILRLILVSNAEVKDFTMPEPITEIKYGTMEPTGKAKRGMKVYDGGKPKPEILVVAEEK